MLNKEFFEKPQLAKVLIRYASWTPRQISQMIEAIEDTVQEELKSGEEFCYHSVGQQDPINKGTNLILIPGLSESIRKTINKNVVVYPERHEMALAMRYGSVARPVGQPEHRLPLELFLKDRADITGEFLKAAEVYKQTGDANDFPKQNPNQEWLIPGKSDTRDIYLKHTVQLIDDAPISFWILGNDQERMRRGFFQSRVKEQLRRFKGG